MISEKSIKFCAPFKIDKIKVGHVMDAADEFLINYSPAQNDLNKLLEFLKTYEDKRVSINWMDGIDVREAALISKVADNAVHRICSLGDFQKAEKLISEKVPYYFGEEFAARNWTQLEGQIALGATDVFIFDDLTFQLSDVRNYCDKHNVKIRIILDKLSSSMSVSRKIPVYFPQNIDYMAIYYDIAEFSTTDEHKLRVLYKTWFVKKEWLGNIQEINPDILFPYPTPIIPKRFVRFRSNCGQRCLHGGYCDDCNKVPDLAMKFLETYKQVGGDDNDSDKEAV